MRVSVCVPLWPFSCYSHACLVGNTKTTSPELITRVSLSVYPFGHSLLSCHFKSWPAASSLSVCVPLLPLSCYSHACLVIFGAVTLHTHLNLHKKGSAAWAQPLNIYIYIYILHIHMYVQYPLTHMCYTIHTCTLGM